MNRAGSLILFMLLITSHRGWSQGSNSYNGGFWKLASLDGEARLKMQYRHRYTELQNGFEEFQNSTYFSGGLKLNTRHYIWHPNFLQLDLGGEYFPESNQDDYLVTPDRSEVRTLKGLNTRVIFLNNKPLTLSSWANWSDSYRNRENLTNIRAQTTRWGSALNFTNRFLPVYFIYNDTKWNEREVQTGRTYRTEQGNFEASARKSFSSLDRNELTYSHNRYFRRDANLYELENITDNIRLNNSLFFDQEKRYAFRSLIYNYNRRGSQNFHIFNVTENLNLKLPANFRFNGNYNLYNQQQEAYESSQNKVMTSLSHKLFLSLDTRVYYEYSGIYHTQYRETRNTWGADIRYTKKIPTGRLTLSYNYSLLRNDMNADPLDLPVINEPVVLTDGEITLLGRPFVDVATVLVKDVTGSIIYEEGFDYMLLENGDYTEIQRMPGGQIPNGSTVYTDYTAIQTGSYKYDAHSNSIYAGISVLNRLVEIYYRGRFMDYKNVEKSDLLTLNYLKGNTLGGKIGYWDAELGVEYEDHNSTITPYKLMRYFLYIQKRVGKFILSANGNIRKYNMLDEDIIRKYSDISGKATYQIDPKTKVDLMLGYRHQRGPGIDLDLVTASSELRTSWRKLILSVVLDLYMRDYLGEINNYYGGHIQITRIF